LELSVALVGQPLKWNKSSQNILSIVLGANVQTGSVGSFTAIAESMDLDVCCIGANNLSVNFDL
jgi:hypothetical protein